MNSETRFVAPASTTIPSTANSISAWYSPWPASAAASERADSSTVATPANAKIISSESVRSSIEIAPAITDVFSPHCQTPSPAAAQQRQHREPRHDRGAHEGGAQQPGHQHEAGAGGQRDERRDRRPVDMRALHRTTSWMAALTAGSESLSAPCG